jgi:hypothetical protein
MRSIDAPSRLGRILATRRLLSLSIVAWSSGDLFMRGRETSRARTLGYPYLTPIAHVLPNQLGPQRRKLSMPIDASAIGSAGSDLVVISRHRCQIGRHVRLPGCVAPVLTISTGTSGFPLRMRADHS